MKYVLSFFILCSLMSFSQGTGLIVGSVLDKASENTPLAFANVSLKGHDISATTNLSGYFLIENLEGGNYTIVCSFAGYEAKYVDVQVSFNSPTELYVVLEPQNLILPTTVASAIDAERLHPDINSQAIRP